MSGSSLPLIILLFILYSGSPGAGGSTAACHLKGGRYLIVVDIVGMLGRAVACEDALVWVGGGDLAKDRDICHMVSYQLPAVTEGQLNRPSLSSLSLL